jgi:hypothetical protein
LRRRRRSSIRPSTFAWTYSIILGRLLWLQML